MNKEELKAAFEELPDLDPQTPWDTHRLALRKHIAKDKIDKFLRWSTIHATMFVGEAPYIKDEYEELMKDRSLWRTAMREPLLGKPPKLSYATWTSGNMVHQSYHLMQWMNVTNKSLASLNSIVEIGGGYGAMTLLCRRLGFDGNYWCHDLIEFSLLQEYYLSILLSNIHKLYTGADVAKLPDKCDLLIALCSISEMSLEARDPLMSIEADSYLMTYQPDWNGIDNKAYFDTLKKKRNDLRWQEYYNPHFSNHWYLLGNKNE